VQYLAQAVFISAQDWPAQHTKFIFHAHVPRRGVQAVGQDGPTPEPQPSFSPLFQFFKQQGSTKFDKHQRTNDKKRI
jgi:hypothetical protein